MEPFVSDPGPLVRLEEVKRDVAAPSEVFQRLTGGLGGEEPETLGAIARAWRVPRGRFVEWFTTEHAELYEAALKVRAADLALDALRAAMEATPETVGVQKLKADVSLKLASKFDRARYGESMRLEKSVAIGVDAGLLGFARDLLLQGRALRVVEALPEPEETAQGLI